MIRLYGNVDMESVSRKIFQTPPSPTPARRELVRHGIPCPPRVARLIRAEELESFDYILCMDARNLRYLSYIGPVGANVHLLGEYGLSGKEIEDPWYTGRFDRVYDEIALCARTFLDSLPAER